MWIDNGWLLPYPEKELGPPKGLIYLMAKITKQTKGKQTEGSALHGLSGAEQVH